MDCLLSYIPKHLHFDDKPIVNSFTEGEQLFYRCKENEMKKPYDNIPLFDISHNRNFGDNVNYPKEDVLYNILEEDKNEKYDSEIVVLTIRNLGNEMTYFKRLVSRTNPKLVVEIKLIHDPVPCMYPHSVFEVSMGGTVVSRENYKKTLGKKNASLKELRSDVRQELSSIIQTGRIDSEEDITYIEEL